MFEVNKEAEMLLKDKVCVVTGGANGIGKGIAVSMAKEGAHIGIIDLNETEGKKTLEEIKGYGVNGTYVKGDVTDMESLEKAKQEIVRDLGKVDILVVNAGISYKHSFEKVSVEEWKRVIDINLSGSFYTVKAFLNTLLEKDEDARKSIIFITSGSAFTGGGGGVHYTASKSGQHGLMRALAKEYGKIGINVNAIAPRVIATEILDQLYPDEKSREQLIEQIPIRRIGQPEDIGNLACFLASDKASYIHGQIILMDGGRTFQ